ncbi:MAG: hypothetical protein ACR2NU_05635 [Aeoliella sp.]
MTRRFQFSLRQFILATTVIGLLLSLLGSVLVYQRTEARKSRLMYPIIAYYDASVSLKNERIGLLDGDSNTMITDGFLTNQELIDIGYAHGYRGEHAGQPFDDNVLANIVSEHDVIEVLDIRNTAVTANGLRHLEATPRLRWLALDSAHCNEIGMEHLARLPRLQRLMVDGMPDAETIRSLRQVLGACEIRTRTNVEPASIAK